VRPIRSLVHVNRVRDTSNDFSRGGILVDKHQWIVNNDNPWLLSTGHDRSLVVLLMMLMMMLLAILVLLVGKKENVGRP
jgi:hypothetical protein